MIMINILAEESVQKGRDYIMQNKFELLEQPDVSDHQMEDAEGDTRIFRTRVKITHPVQAMVSSYILRYWSAS